MTTSNDCICDYTMLLIYRADNAYDVVELQARGELKTQSVGKDNSFGEKKDENMKENPAYHAIN